MKCESDLLSWVVILMVAGIVLVSAKSPHRENMVYDLRQVDVTFPLVTVYGSGVEIADDTQVNYNMVVTPSTTGSPTTNIRFTMTGGNLDGDVVVEHTADDSHSVTAVVAVSGTDCTVTISNLPFEDDYTGAAASDITLSVGVTATVSDLEPVNASVDSSNLTDEQKGLGQLQPVTGVTVSVQGVS